MSYGTNIYSIDLAKLRRAVGSGDEDLIQQVLKHNSERFERSDGWFKNEIDQGAPTLSQAVKELIRGPLTSPTVAAFQYGYALELLCRELGEDMQTYEVIDSIWDLDIGSPLAKSNPPVPIPIPDDFPDIGHLTADGAAAEFYRLSAMDLSHLRQGVEEARLALLSCVEMASQSRQGLVTFRY